ncbi:MAG: BrnT family toxin [Zoogloeaceae bacterium]|jgi:uncharacterized DUF497 family protein|nr:BrnT family toxin [Zoogloeaceae bacterium]
MNFTFDPEKRQINLRKHGLDLADAAIVFSGVTFTRPDHRFQYNEMRFSTTGLLGVEVVVMAHTEEHDTIRVISMRKAERHEREAYFTIL